jgi:hypothetical protein
VITSNKFRPVIILLLCVVRGRDIDEISHAKYVTSKDTVIWNVRPTPCICSLVVKLSTL